MLVEINSGQPHQVSHTSTPAKSEGQGKCTKLTASREDHGKVDLLASIRRPELLASRWDRRTSVIRSFYWDMHRCRGSGPLSAHPVFFVPAFKLCPSLVFAMRCGDQASSRRCPEADSSQLLNRQSHPIGKDQIPLGRKVCGGLGMLSPPGCGMSPAV